MSTSKPSIELEIEEKVLGYKWRAPMLEKKLIYDMEKCIGCGLCEKVCPVNAISLGPVKDIASGKIEAPYIIIDETKCVACPLCSSICPSGALKLMLQSDFEHPKVKGIIRIDKEKCLPCLLCEKICPRKAISVSVKVEKKDELVKYVKEGEAWGKGTIKVDLNKCCYCGLCELLCDAIKIEWIDPQPPSFKLGASIAIDESKCDYCGLCEKICPVQAIKVECTESAPRIIEEPKIEGTINVDEEKCVWCGLCSGFCSVKAIEVEKPFKGDIYMIQPNECDPSGCKNCINICPANVVYIAKPPSKDKMCFIKDYCIYCGACENACPVNAIRVIRSDLRIEGLESPWTNMSNEQFKRVLTGYKPPKPSVYHRSVKIEEVQVTPPPPPPMPPTPKGFEKAVKALDKLMNLLSSVPGRIMFEKNEVDKLALRLRGGEGG